MSLTGTPWDFLLLGLAVLASFVYGYFEGRCSTKDKEEQES